MKISRLILSAGVVLAVVGSAIAFKAPKFGSGTLYCKFTTSGTCSTNANYVTGSEATMYCGASEAACNNNTSTTQDVRLVAD